MKTQIALVLAAMVCCRSDRPAARAQAAASPDSLSAVLGLPTRDSAGLAEPPPLLGDSDLIVAGVRYGADTSEVRRTLGRPLFANGESWQYHDVTIHLAGSRVTEFTITGPAVPTHRGLRVGDAESRVIALYGDLTCMQGYYVYQLQRVCDPEVAGVGPLVTQGSVTEIWVGEIVTAD